MSSYSFSHQFYQHWMRAPEPIRAAIVQELTDITTLLQMDTPFEEFVFSQPDLDAHLNKLYNTHESQQAAAKEVSDKQAQRAAEQQRLEEKKQAKEEKTKIEQDIKSQQEAAQKQQDQAADKNSITDKMPDNKTSNNDNDNESADTINDNNTAKNLSANQVDTDNNYPDDPKQDAAIERSPKAPKLSKGHEDLIHELGLHIDDYLSEQMAQLSEDLKSWLQAEVSRQLSTASGQATDSMDKKKNNQ